jgi:hypothetical protein
MTAPDVDDKQGGCRVSAETEHGPSGGGTGDAARPAGSPGRSPDGSPDGSVPSVGELVRGASEQMSALIRAEIELAKAELSATAKRAGVGAGFITAAGVIALLSLPFLFVTLAEVLVAVGLPRWSAYLIVWGLFMISAVALGLLGVRLVRRLRKPERTIETVKETARWARHPTAAPSTAAPSTESAAARPAGPTPPATT